MLRLVNYVNSKKPDVSQSGPARGTSEQPNLSEKNPAHVPPANPAQSKGGELATSGITVATKLDQPAEHSILGQLICQQKRA